MALPPLHRRILELSWKRQLSHIGSCLGAVDELDRIYQWRDENDPVILSAGHCGLALYTVLEKHCGKNAEDLLLRHGVHPSKNAEDGIYASTGSLGQGLTLACGRALANRDRKVWCVISDGEAAEGSVYESLRFIHEHELDNLHVSVLINEYGAYRYIDALREMAVLRALLPRIQICFNPIDRLGIPFLQAQSGHYHVQTPADWAWVEAQEIQS